MAVTTAVPLTSDRWSPPALIAQAATAAAESGVVDELLVWDQLTNFWPRQLWSPEHAPMASVLPDLDSYSDAIATAAYVAGAAPPIGLSVSTDAIRRGPAEITQTMMTLANMTAGRATIMIGAGESKQVTPFGWKRSEGLARLEDHLKAFHALWDSEEPVDLEGNHWSFKQAWLGQARGHKPKVWALGGGPKLLDLATSYADGMAAIVPCVFHTPEDFAAEVDRLKADLERKGRDPKSFAFGIWFMALVHEDRAVIEQALDSAFMRYMAGVFGRLDQEDWVRDGHENPMPLGWHYAMKLRPVEWTQADIDEVVGKVDREMAAKAFTHGTTAEVAAEVQSYVDAGATWVSVCDLLPLLLDPEDAQRGLARNLDVCGRLKQTAVPA